MKVTKKVFYFGIEVGGDDRHVDCYGTRHD